MVLLIITDACILYYAVHVTRLKGPSMMLLFGFEFMILAISVLSTGKKVQTRSIDLLFHIYLFLFQHLFETKANSCLTFLGIKFIINALDSRQEGTWERKGALILYLEFITDITQLLIYLAFFGIIMMYYGLPLHIVRNVYLSLRSLSQCVASLMRYRKATANMNERYHTPHTYSHTHHHPPPHLHTTQYTPAVLKNTIFVHNRFPDVTPEELANSDQICIVCREDLTTGKRLPCGHILHFHCLLNWLQRQQTCPICR